MEHKVLARYPIGNPRRAWKQDNFILGIVSPGPFDIDVDDPMMARKTRRSVQTAVEAGFTLIGSLWSSPSVSSEILHTTEQLGARMLFQNMKRCGGMGDKNIFCKKHDLEGLLRELAPWKSLYGVWMWDEPLLDEHLALTRELNDRCQRIRPDILPVNVAVPSYNDRFCWDNGQYTEYIRKYMDVIDPAQMMFDYYPIGLPGFKKEEQLDGVYPRESTLWCDLEMVRREAQARDIPFWFMYQGCKFHFYPHIERFVFPMVRAMANSGILHGAKALDYYAEFEGVIDPETGGKGYFFREQKQLNQELKVLGNTLMALTCQRVIHDETLLPGFPHMEGLRSTMAESELLTGKLNPRVSVSEHSDAYGNRYLMVLNRDYEQDAYMELRLKAKSHVHRVSREDGEEQFLFYAVEKLPVHLAPGDLALYRLQPADTAPFSVEYQLEKSIPGK